MKQKKGQFNSVFEALCFIWLFGNVIKFFFSFITAFIGLYSEDYLFLIEPLTRLLLIIGFVLLLWKKNKTAFFIITFICILNISLNLVLAGVGEMIGNAVPLTLFLVMFFFLKRNGKTAYQIVFKG